MKHEQRRRMTRCVEKILLVGHLMLLGFVVGLGCSESVETEPVSQASTTTDQAGSAPTALSPQFGGLIQALGPYVAEILSNDDGRLEAQIRDLQGQPVSSDGASLTVEVGQGDSPIQVAMTPEGDRYVGTVAGASGPAPVALSYTPPGTDRVVNATFPEVALHAVEVEVEPRHQGQVSIVGDNRVELTAAPSGEVMVSVTDLRGTPVPPSEVEFQEVRVVTPSGPQVVTLEPQGAVFVGSLAAPPPPSFSVSYDINVRGRPYHSVYFRGYRPVAPGVVVIAPPPPPRWGPPTVDVYIGGHPGRIKGHRGKGWAKGHYHGKGHYRGKGRGKGHYYGGHRGKGHGKGRGKGRGHGKR